MTLTLLDHLLIALIVVVFPFVDRRSLLKKRTRIEQGEPGVRARMYGSIIWQEWLGTLVLLAMWFGLGRTFAGLTEVTPLHSQPWVGYLLAAGILALLYLQIGYVIKHPERRATTKAQMADTMFMIPGTPKERRLFAGVSVTAGICEELFFRGYLIAYLIALTGMPLWGAIGLSSAVFGFSHIYQGPAGFVRTGLAGLGFGVMYGLTGALWAPIVLHVAVDLASGRLGTLLFHGNGQTPPVHQAA